jgi:hypothetical protein
VVERSVEGRGKWIDVHITFKTLNKKPEKIKTIKDKHQSKEVGGGDIVLGGGEK